MRLARFSETLMKERIMKTNHKNLKNFFMLFLMVSSMLLILSSLLVSGYQTKVADVTIDFTWIELAKDGDPIGKGEIYLKIEDHLGYYGQPLYLGQHNNLDEWDPDISKTWTRVFFDVTPTWHIEIFDADLFYDDTLFFANLTVHEYTGTGTKYANNKENWGTEIAGWGVPKHETARNDYIGTYCNYMWKLGEANLNTFWVWVSNPPDYVATSARLTISVTIDYYWWNIW